MMELKKEVTLDFDCCQCNQPVGVTLRCEGKGLGAGLGTVAAVNVPCPTCGAVNRLLFEPSGRVHALGAGSVLELYERFGYHPRDLHAKTLAFLERTEGLYLGELERALRARVGVAIEDAGPADINRLMRAPEFDAGFPSIFLQ